MKKLTSKLFTIIVTVILCVSLTGCAFFMFGRGDKDALADSSTVGSGVVFEQQTDQRTLYTDYAEVAPKVMRSVVVIEMVDASAYGSGVIVEIDGENYVITCHHVISSGGTINVYIPDENARNFGDDDYDEKYALAGVIEANRFLNQFNDIILIGGDKDADIAVLKINKNGLNLQSSPIPADGYSIRYAEKIFTIGNPSGQLPMTFMSGNISYLRRQIYLSSVGEMEVVQHDASINHGSSGGGLFNMYGELIGITNAGNDAYYNLNYAIPFDGDNGYVNIAKQLIGSYNNLTNNFGYITGRWALGITVTSSTTVINNSSVSISVVNAGSNCDGILKVKDRLLKVSYVKDGVEKSFKANTHEDFAYAVSQLKKDFVANAQNPPKFTVSVYRPNVGELDLEVQLKDQFIFCDTGIYN